jgi:signal transduction histidine kinase
VRQQENRTSSASSSATGASFDAIRLEQFLDLQRDVLLATGDPETLPERLVQRVAVLLGVAGAAVGVVHEGRYRVLAVYGVGPAYRARYDGMAVDDSELAPALAGAHPLVLSDCDGDVPLRTLILPFPASDMTGALHVVVAERVQPADDELQLARALAGLAGIALANARQCRRLAQAAQLKGDALTAMAHDLRAPLNALVGYAGLLGEGAFGPLSAEQRDVSATLERQANELVDLLGAALDVARLETGHLPIRIEEFDLGEVAAALATSTFARATRDRRLVVAVAPALPPLRTDRVKLKEIVQNLVGNALAHGGAPVVLEVALVAEREDTVRITVRDAGPGIATDVLPHLFEPFRPGPGGETGFGLYIVRCFSEALGGRVAVQSDPASGTTITVELPRVAPGVEALVITPVRG